MSAVATISKPDTAVMFTATREDLRLVKIQRYPIFGPGGRQVGQEPGQAFQFRDHLLRVRPEGVTLEDGRTLSSEEALEWLRGHRLCGDTQEGFTELHQAAPQVTEAEMDALLEASFGDEEGLTALIEAERAGWGREAFLRPALKALERIHEAMALAEQPEPGDETPAPKRAARRSE